MRAVAVVLCALPVLAVPALGGPLTPPAGAVAPTGKTLAQVEPRTPVGAGTTPGDNDATPSLYKLTQPGSYYLAGPITGVAGKAGIEIAAPGVTLDLNGFEMRGVDGSLAGVVVTVVGASSIVVRNGAISEWGGWGVDASLGRSIVCEDLVVRRNTGGGMNLGMMVRVQRCTADDNYGTGIEVFGNGSVTDCVANSNARGIVVNFGVTIERCTVTTNSGNGIRGGSSNRIVNNSSYNNGNGAADGAGIHVTGGDNHIEGNTASTNDRGFDVDVGGNFVARNTAAGNGQNYAITGTQTIGPIVSTAGTISSTSPWANFSY